MKFNFRKIASVVASAVMLGSTVGIAAAASYPAPFVSGGMADVAIVYGSNAAVSDLSAAIDVQTNLQGKVTGSSASSASATGGDSVNLASSSQELYLNSSLNVAKSILTKDHLPTLLADGSAYDLTGVEYKFTQTLTPGSGVRQIAFSKSGESMDPDLMVDVGYSASSAPFYTYALTFNKAINVTDTTNVVGAAQVTILGKQFTIGANSDADTLYLYGSGESVTVDEGETSTVAVDGKDHTISLIGSSSTTSATIEIDGVRRTMTVGSSYKFSEGFEVYFKDLFHATKTGTLSSADLLVGSKSLHFENNQAVRYGSDDSSILGTYATIATSSGKLSSLSIKESAESSLGDFIKTGETFTDRVFGNLVIENVGPVPALDSDTRDMVKVDTDQSVAARAIFTTDLSEGEEFTLTFARDADATENGVLASLNHSYENGYFISYKEGQQMKVNDYYVVNDNDEGRILRVLQVPTGSSTNDFVRFKDVITDEEYDFTTGLSNATTAAVSIGGGTYSANVTVNNTDTAQSTVMLTWGAGASAGSAGTQTTLYPRIKLANGEWMSFLTQATLINGTTYQLPGDYLLSTYKSGYTFANTTTSYTVGNVIYKTTPTSAGGTLFNATIAGTYCTFNSTVGPAVLIVEEKTTDTSNGHAICIPMTSVTSGSTIEPAIGTPLFSDTAVSSGQTLQSDSFKTQWLDAFGTLVTRDTATGTNNIVSVSYPDDQMYVEVFFKSAEATITPGSEGSTGSGNVLIVKDSEVSSVSSKNLLVIGGSCINTVAREMIDSEATAPICGADWTAKTNVGPGQYLLKSVESPWNKDKVAMLVAGYDAAQTVSAVAKLKEGHMSDAGTENIYPITSA